jgi:hypothetical protein
MKAFGSHQTFPPSFGFFTDAPEAGSFKPVSCLILGPSEKENSTVSQ